MRRLATLLACLVLVVGCGTDDEPPAAGVDERQVERKLSGAPAPLAKLHAQANHLLQGGPGAFRERLAELRGFPVVVNKWASWCAPCRAEFPFFQRQAKRRGTRIAFLGVNANDSDSEATQFLRRYPVPFPSYTDRNLKVSAEIKAVAAFPSTAFYSSNGELAYVKQGGYATERKLAEDIERYAR